MPATWRARRRPLTGTARVRLLGTLLALLLATPLSAALGVAAPAQATPTPAPTPTYVKYYVVAAAYQGQPETLSEIAGRFLGSATRAGEIFSRNAGIRQADGGTLTDPAVLHAGWVLLLPWDAVGPEVRYGFPPTTVPAPSPATTTPA
ncbi:MAG TPA: hypothetical protein VHA75_02490, partial [Rugosimonospora sp.]|nr:hypothetical protein [Rugosimonospora sp.]